MWNWWNYCLVCECPGVTTLQGIRIQSLIQHTVISSCVAAKVVMVLRQHSIQFNTLRPVQNVRGFISPVINILCKISLSDDESSLVQIMAWCHQATSHYLIQSWPRSMPSHDVTRPRWVRQFSWQRVNHCRMSSNSYIQNKWVGTNK